MRINFATGAPLSLKFVNFSVIQFLSLGSSHRKNPFSRLWSVLFVQKGGGDVLLAGLTRITGFFQKTALYPAQLHAADRGV